MTGPVEIDRMLPSAAGQRGKPPGIGCICCRMVRYSGGSPISPLAAGPILPELPDNSGNLDHPVANGFGGYDYVCIGSRVSSRRMS